MNDEEYTFVFMQTYVLVAQSGPTLQPHGL